MLKDIFVSEVRVKILKIMMLNPTKQYHVRALVREVGTEINAVRRELSRLTNMGLLRRRQSSNRIYYTVDTNSLYYPELLSLVAKETHIGIDIINNAKYLGNIKYVILSRAYLRGRVSTVLDVDLFIVGSVNLDVIERIVKSEQLRVGRDFNYSVMGEEEFIFRKRRNDQFIAKVLSQSRTMLIGDEEELCAL